MKRMYFYLIVCIISSSQILGNMLLNDNKLLFSGMMTQQDTTKQNKTGTSMEPFQSNRALKSPGKALLYSGLLPGLGQAYMGNWLRALIFVALDGVAINIWYQNNDRAEDKKREYSYYANKHWNFGTWVHDYYKWYEYKGDLDPTQQEMEWNSIREAFINFSDSTIGCAQDPTKGVCYTDIWNHSHNVEFTWDGNVISSNSDDFKDIYIDLCAQNPNQTHVPTGKICENEIEEINEILTEKNVYVIKNHHFSEGIQKYNYYFAGWDDSDSVAVVNLPNGTKNAQSPHQKEYRGLWKDYDKIERLAKAGGNYMLISRVVSMLDALILAKRWNNNHDVKLSLNTYPDLRNNSGVGGVKLSLFWK